MIKKLALYVSIALIAVSCTYDNEQELFDKTGCGTPAVSLEEDVQPIMAANCAVAGCHVTGSQFPDFTAKQNIISHASRVKTYTSSGAMPPAGSGRSLTTQEIGQIGCWVNSGAPDN